MKQKTLLIVSFSILANLVFLHKMIAQGVTCKSSSIYFTGGNVCNNNNYNLVFWDEFDGTNLDTNKWYGFYPYGNNNSDSCSFCRTHDTIGNQQIYKDENRIVSNGIAKLMIKKEPSIWMGYQTNFSAGMLHSKQVFTDYSKFEIRCKLPRGVGLGSSFWLFGWSTEIDIFEISGDKPCDVHQTIHKWGPGAEHIQCGNVYKGDDYSADFHTFSAEYTAFTITFLIDNKPVKTVSRYIDFNMEQIEACEVPAGVYQQLSVYPRDANPIQIIIAPSIATGKNVFQSAPNANTVFPNQMEIDYVRVYQKEKDTSQNCIVDSIKIFPNPVKDILQVQLNTNCNFNIIERLFLKSIDGKELIEPRYSYTNNNKISISLDDKLSGIYVLQIITKNNIYSAKVIIK
jgi:beta-glucanase (GH16 family)